MEGLQWNTQTYSKDINPTKEETDSFIPQVSLLPAI